MELVYFFMLLLKHSIADIGIQRHLGWMGKQNYKSKKAQLHYVSHGIGTFLILIPSGLVPAVLASLVDWIAHWHIDYAKSKANNHFELSQSNIAYWWLLTLDQLLHYLTYLVIVVLFVYHTP
jgi:hypothetical protein